MDTIAPKKRRRGVRLEREERERAQAAFLDAFATSANLRAACKVAGVSRTTVYGWQEHDEAFSFRYQQAEADANDVIRAAIYNRAVTGVDKPLHYQGRIVQREVIGPDGKRRLVDATVREYSDTLLIFLAKARMPEFRDRQHVEHSGSLDVNVLAADADAKFRAFLTAASAVPLLGQPERGTEG